MNNGCIELILGPMFSGKTSELLRRLRRAEIAGQKCLLVKHTIDDRYAKDAIVRTHDGTECPAIRVAKLADALSACADRDVIGVDEGQFFEDVACEAERLASTCGKRVIVAACDATFRRTPFGKILDLVPLAEHVVKLSAVCVVCKRDAAFSQRTVSDDTTVRVGGSDAYRAVCRQCYHTLAAKQ